MMVVALLRDVGSFLGGCFINAGDPGVGIWLVPIGALCLFTSVLLMAIGLVQSQESSAEPAVEDTGQKTKRKRRRGK